VFVWDAVQQELIFGAQVYQETTSALSWSPDGTILATSGSEGIYESEYVGLWDAASWEPLEPLEISQATDMQTLAWSPDGSMLAVSYFDLRSNRGKIHIWNADNGENLVDFNAHNSEVTGLSWSFDGLSLTSTGQDGTMRIWGISP
jgi:WD40 repeat protein